MKLKSLVFFAGMLFVAQVQAAIIPGFYEGKSEKKQPAKVFIKEVIATTPKGRESNYFGFLQIGPFDKENLSSALFWIEEAQPGLQVWYKIGTNSSQRSIQRKETPTYEVSQFIDDGDFKLRFSSKLYVNIEARKEKNQFWSAIPNKGIQLEKDESYEGFLTPSTFVGKIGNLSGSYGLKMLFTGAYMVIAQNPNSTSKKGYDEEKEPAGFFVIIKDHGDFLVNYFASTFSADEFESTATAEQD